MEELHGRDITPAHIGRIDQIGRVWVWIADVPLIPGGATVKRDDDSLIDYGPDHVVWLRDEVRSA